MRWVGRRTCVCTPTTFRGDTPRYSALKIRRLVRLLTITLLLSGTARAAEIHVDDDAAPLGDGASWATAYRCLQDAIAVAVPGDVIRVAQGVYVPDETEAQPDGTGDRTASFVMATGVIWEGGYQGLGGGDPDERDIAGYVTTLSGDLLGDDAPAFANRGDNSYHVVIGTGVNLSAIIDGMTIRSGNADGPPPWHNLGGGLLCRPGSPTVRECTFIDNLVGNLGHGGGMASDRDIGEGGSPLIIDCSFIGNRADYNGGGLYNFRSRTVVVDCHFEGNSVVLADGNKGGAMMNDEGAVVVLCSTFVNNHADEIGGGIYAANGATTLRDCLVLSNTSIGPGGGVHTLNDDTKICDTVICGNTPDEITGSYTDCGVNRIGPIGVDQFLELLAWWGECTLGPLE